MHCEPAFLCGENVFDKNVRVLYEYICYYLEINTFLDIYTIKYILVCLIYSKVMLKFTLNQMF